MEISSGEVLRYLGYRGAAADEKISSQINELIELFSANIVPRSLYGVWGCRLESSTVFIGGMTVNSKNLAAHLEGCQSAVLLAATLGPNADTLIRRLTVQDMEKAVIAQAVCAAMIEAYCELIGKDLSQKRIEPSVRCAKGAVNCFHLTARFSPGYGDFDIIHQKDILDMLNCSRIGLALTDGYMLIPSKSVTAVIGLSSEKKQVAGKCGHCADKNCGQREAG